MSRKTLLYTVIILCVASSTLAQGNLTRGKVFDRAGKWDYTFQTHYLGSSDVSRDGGSSISFNDDLGWGFGFYYNFNEKFSLGLDFGWHSIQYDAVVVAGDDPSHTERYSNNLDTSKFGVAGNWNILEGRYTPYLNAGVGWAMLDTNIFAGWDGGCYWDPYGGYICGNYPTSYGTTATAYNVGIGGRFELTETFFMRLGYEYSGVSLDAVEAQHQVRFDLGFFN